METAPLCKCLICEQTYVDMNPQTNQTEYPCDGLEAITFQEDEEGSFWGCPECGSDYHLIDL